MYKTSAEVQSTRKGLVTVEMNSEMDNVDIYVRTSIDCKIVREANIDLLPEEFINLICPILQAKGYRIITVSEEI